MHRDALLRLPPTAITGYAVVLIADSILARSTCRRRTSTGWNTAYIGANRSTLPPGEKPPADDRRGIEPRPLRPQLHRRKWSVLQACRDRREDAGKAGREFTRLIR